MLFRFSPLSQLLSNLDPISQQSDVEVPFLRMIIKFLVEVCLQGVLACSFTRTVHTRTHILSVLIPDNLRAKQAFHDKKKFRIFEELKGHLTLQAVTKAR